MSHLREDAKLPLAINHPQWSKRQDLSGAREDQGQEINFP